MKKIEVSDCLGQYLEGLGKCGDIVPYLMFMPMQTGRYPGNGSGPSEEPVSLEPARPPDGCGIGDVHIGWW